MKIANIFISLFFTIITGFQSIALYSLGTGGAKEVGAVGILLTISLFISVVFSIEKPYISTNALLFFGIFAGFIGIFTAFTDLAVYAVVILSWDYFFNKSLENEGGQI